MNMEKPNEMPEFEKITVQEMINFLVNHPEDSKEILGYVLSEEESKKLGGLESQQIMKIAKKMDLEPMDTETLDKLKKNNIFR